MPLTQPEREQLEMDILRIDAAIALINSQLSEIEKKRADMRLELAELSQSRARKAQIFQTEMATGPMGPRMSRAAKRKK